MQRPPIEIDAEEFITVKGFKAKGKRITTLDVADVKELEPTRHPEPESDNDESNDDDEPENLDPDAGKSQQQVIDEMTGQLNIFTENEDL